MTNAEPEGLTNAAVGSEEEALLSTQRNASNADSPSFSLPTDDAKEHKDHLAVTFVPVNISPSSSIHNSFSRDNFGRLTHSRGPEEDWMTQPLRIFTEKYRGKQAADKKLPSGVREFYRRQDSLIMEFQQVEEDLMKDASREPGEGRLKAIKLCSRMAQITMICNLILLAGKATAVYLSNSLSVISSLVDSCVDVSSGIIIWWTNRVVMQRNPYKFPQGRTRLEPVAIIILSAIMASASLQVIKEAIQNIVQMATNKAKSPDINVPTLILVGATVFVKIILFCLCCYLSRNQRKYMQSVAVLGQDQKNDVLANSVVLIATIITRYYEPAKYSDPVGAILIGLYIIVGWWKTGSEHIKTLTGHTADPHLLQKLTFICINHHKSILSIDTVRAFYHGSNIFAEVDIVLPASMKLRDAHDIGESLQVKLERLDEVERAFVHLDYESVHDPRTEHKQV